LIDTISAGQGLQRVGLFGYIKRKLYSVKERMSIPAQVITCAGDALDFSIMVYAAMT
jgi:hypothetical protein